MSESTQCEERCCSPFDPGPWDGETVTWSDKKFVKDRVRCLFHVPLNFKSVMVRNVALIEEAGAKPDPMIVLSDNTSLWGAEVYIEVTGDVPGATMTTLSGTFLSKVFEGPYSQTGKWVRGMKEYVSAQGKALKKLLFYYTTCPRCARSFGKNYVVLLARI